MAITSVGSVGTAAASASGTTLAMTPTTQLNANNLAILVIASNNINTTDGNFSEVTSVTDTPGNVWVKLGEYTNGEGGAASGVTCSVWATVARFNVTTGQSITANWGSAITDRCSSCWQFSLGNGELAQLDTNVSLSGADNATDALENYGSVSFTGLANLSRLYFRGLAKEANSTVNITPSTGFTAITATRSRNNVNAVFVRGEFRINTSTSETSDPVLAVIGDTAGVFRALVSYTSSEAAFVGGECGAVAGGACIPC